jgi:hypothetical protein
MKDKAATKKRAVAPLIGQGVGAPVKRPVGRPSVYDPAFADMLIEFFSQPPIREVITHDAKGNEIRQNLPGTFPTLARFATNIGVTKQTLHDWATAKVFETGELKNPEFSDAYKKAKDLQEANLIEGTIGNAYNSTFAIFTAKNVLGWRDKIEQEITGKDGAPLQSPSIQVSFVMPDGNSRDSLDS